LENEKLVVPASGAKFGKTLLGGGFRVAYPCPRCKRELETENDAVAGSDKCPHCGASFVFDDIIKEKFLALAAEKRAREASKQAEAEARADTREANRKKAERLAKEAERLWIESEVRRQPRDILGRLLIKEKHETDARSIDGARGWLQVILFLGVLSVAIMFVGAFREFGAGMDGGAGALLAAGFSTAVLLALVYVFFRILAAIHAVLVMLLDKLPPPNSEGTSTISSESTPRK